jgi:predicted glycogen debranching enzyme
VIELRRDLFAEPSTGLVRRVPWARGEGADPAPLLDLEWLVTNAVGGYASGTVAGVATRRYHGLLVAALPGLGRTLMLGTLAEEVRLPDGRCVRIGGEERPDALEVDAACLAEFRLEAGLPVWTYDLMGEAVVEKRVLMPYGHNTVHVTYRLIRGDGPLRLRLYPSLNCRPHDEPFDQRHNEYRLSTPGDDCYELTVGGDLPTLRMKLFGHNSAFTIEWRTLPRVHRVEASRGYGPLAAVLRPGHLRAYLTHDAREATLLASTESWDAALALPPAEALAAERQRRERLVLQADPRAREGPAAELVLAADQFLITPAWRVESAARARASGCEPRSVIAGYHWFTDWGRDTMISLEGLTLTTGRQAEARQILRTFADAVKDGLIPNLFPEGQEEGLYHTADATLWFFHALDRYVETTGDRALVRELLPKLRDVVGAHLAGTRYGIGVDPADGLLRQGAPGYQLTWMDAKVGDWVVTPRRGKAVELNALWFNALRLLEGWERALEGEERARWLAEHAERARASFAARFWFEEGGHLYDVVDGEDGRDDPACRPNQVLSISLRHPILERARWAQVMQVVEERLLTPVGLRSLAAGHPDYKRTYFGDLKQRDAAYHQGTVWGWLIGPFVDAWLKVHDGDRAGARRHLQGLIAHLGEAGVGQVSEIFDAEAPFTARGCIAQAWSVAELLRCWVQTSTGGEA